jgi:hypothetical protein
MAREHRQQIEEENEPPIQIEAVESDNGDEEEENTTYNIAEILHAMGLTANGPGSTESSRRNLHENIGLDDLINAHLEDFFRHDDETVFESDEPADPEDAIDDPDEQSRWFPFKNKMVSFFFPFLFFFLLIIDESKLTYQRKKKCGIVVGACRVVVDRTHPLTNLARNIQQIPCRDNNL